MKIIVFDMDDTLYDEAKFVQSGLEAVATFMAQSWGIPKAGALATMRRELAANGRGAVFDAALGRYGIVSKNAVRLCLRAYRSHKPKIALYPDARRALKRLQSHSLYVVTDGNPVVQRAKARALELPQSVKQVITTWHRGRTKGKPSPFVFNEIARREGASPSDLVYIGDDPNKDFIGIKPRGFKTIRIMRGRFKYLHLSAAHDAHHHIKTLDEITETLLKKLHQSARHQ